MATSSSVDAVAAATAQLTFTADDLPHILSNVVKLKSALTKFIEPDFGLLDQLLSLEVLTRFDLAEVRSEKTVYRRNKAFLELITSENQCSKFLTALRRTGQQHVVNFVTQNGDVGAEYGDVCPLSEARMRTLNVNAVHLLDLIDPNHAFVTELAAAGCITQPQRERIIETVHSRDRNDKLLEFLTRRSVSDLEKFAKVLSKYQAHLVPLLVSDRVVVRLDAELDESFVGDVVQCEDRIVSQSRELLPAGSNSEIQQAVDAIVRPLGLQTKLLVLERVSSIAVLFVCMTLSALLSLRDHWRTGQLRDIVQSLFTFLSFDADEVRVKRLTWPQSDYERSKEFFCPSQEGAEDIDFHAGITGSGIPTSTHAPVADTEGAEDVDFPAGITGSGIPTSTHAPMAYTEGAEDIDFPAGITGSGIPTSTHAPTADTAEAAAATMDIGWDFKQELEELKSAFKSGGIEECRTLLERKRDEWKQIPLDVAVIGNSGVGKSSFINAIRRLTEDDEDGAPVGRVEVTEELRCYSHPSNPLLKFWDLPGEGTDRFPRRQTYLSDVKVDPFDFFLLITDRRFTENDTWLGEEFRKRNKKYFFVRTKVAFDIYSNKKAHPRTHNEDDVVKAIRESIQEHLNEMGFKDVPLFLIDSYELMKFDFELLERRLIEDFPKLKKAALAVSLQSMSKEMIHLKVAELRSRMWKVAAGSGMVAAIPMLSWYSMTDIDSVAKEAAFYYTQLGLDETSLKRYAKLTETDYRQMKSIVDRCLGFRTFSVEGIRELVQSPSATVLYTSAEVDVVEASRFIPLIGSFIAAPVAFKRTYNALNLVLDKMESAAMEVVEFAAESATGRPIEESEDSGVD